MMMMRKMKMIQTLPNLTTTGITCCTENDCATPTSCKRHDMSSCCCGSTSTFTGTFTDSDASASASSVGGIHCRSSTSRRYRMIMTLTTTIMLLLASLPTCTPCAVVVHVPVVVLLLGGRQQYSLITATYAFSNLFSTSIMAFTTSSSTSSSTTSTSFSTRIHTRSKAHWNNKLGTLLFFYHTNSNSNHNHKRSLVTRTNLTNNKSDHNTSSSSSVSSSPTSSFEGGTVTKEMLQRFTVKELREKVKALKLPIKISNFKIKQDFVDFLYHQYNTTSSTSNTMNQEDVNKVDVDQQPIASNHHHTTTSTTSTINADPNSTTTRNTSTNNNDNSMSLKEMMFEQVYNRYPPLRDLHYFVQSNNKNDNDNNNNYNNNNRNNQFQSIISYNPNILKNLSGLGEIDIRQHHHPMLKSLTASDFDIVTVGTASCIPGVTRGVSCTALRLQWQRRNTNLGGNNKNNHNAHNNNKSDSGGGDTTKKGKSTSTTGGIWIFDCGESTQLQIQRTSTIRPGKINKIFITHAHGDHSFGLPGLMCIMGQDRDRDGPPLEIYGPEGLRMWIRTCIRYSISRIVPPYRVHELMDIPMAPEWKQSRFKNGRYLHELDSRVDNKKRGRDQWGTQGLAGEDPTSWISRAPMMNLEPSPQFGEIEGGRDIYPLYNHPQCVDGAPVWEVEDEGDVKVYAAPMSHGVPCVGYVVEEQSRPGRLRNDLLEPIAKRNIAALKESGMKHPMKIMATIKDLPEGGSYTFPDGTIVYQNEVVEPPRNGRKIVVCGDTADSRAIAGLAQGADVLIHEATNAFLSGIDKDTSKDEVTKDARIHGHSTPSIAGNFAKEIGAKRLVLNHFSSRYKGDQSPESISIMTRIESEAIKASGLDEDKVVAAWDFMILPVPLK